ncbi:MAG TPA: metallophosphoesterase [Tepidisphaeraceae bacterium]|nr:metallophosphoesterase [Tepidisphaeraceae bacterium]
MSEPGLLVRKTAVRSMRRAWFVAASLLVSVPLYALLVEPNCVEVTYHGESPGGRPPIRIAVLSDLHLDGVGYRERVVIDQLRAVRPDILILAGDVVDEPDDLPALRTLLSQFDVPHAVAILGNWERWGDVPLEQLHTLYRDHNVALLVNTGVQFPVDGRQVRLLGLDDATAGTPRLDLAIRGQEAVDAELMILVQHSPGFFAAKSADAELPDKALDLCLSGHTHGGQITLLGWAFGPLPPGSGPFVAGRYETAACPLYVSRGIGTSVLPVRIFARPEIAVFDL